MEKLLDGCLMVVVYFNIIYEVYVVEFDIQFKMKCIIYGMFGNIGYLMYIKYDIVIKMKGLN